MCFCFSNVTKHVELYPSQMSQSFRLGNTVKSYKNIYKCRNQITLNNDNFVMERRTWNH
uniref:Uncharacterized protein n=1 Tax=Arion vulgaris TaxID=1028688 RepID=A0A0B7B4Q8_9EUPU